MCVCEKPDMKCRITDLGISCSFHCVCRVCIQFVCDWKSWKFKYKLRKRTILIMCVRFTQPFSHCFIRTIVRECSLYSGVLARRWDLLPILTSAPAQFALLIPV